MTNSKQTQNGKCELNFMKVMFLVHIADGFDEASDFLKF